MIDQVTGLMQHLKKRGQLAAGIEAGQAAIIVYSIFITYFLMFQVDTHMTIEGLAERIRESVEIVFRGMAP